MENPGNQGDDAQPGHPAPFRGLGHQHARRSARSRAQVHVGIADADVVVDESKQGEHTLQVVVEVAEIVNREADVSGQGLDLAAGWLALEGDERAGDAAQRTAKPPRPICL